MIDDRFYTMRGEAGKGVLGFDRHASMYGLKNQSPVPMSDFLMLAHFDNSVADVVTGNVCTYAPEGYILPEGVAVYVSGYFSQALAAADEYLRTPALPTISDVVSGQHRDITVSFISKATREADYDLTRLSCNFVGKGRDNPGSGAERYEIGFRVLGFNYGSYPPSGYKANTLYLNGFSYKWGKRNESIEYFDPYEPLEIVPDQWYKIAYHITQTAATLYINGVAKCTVTYQSSPTNPYEEFQGIHVISPIDEVLICDGLFGEDVESQPYPYIPPVQGGD